MLTKIVEQMAAIKVFDSRQSPCIVIKEHEDVSEREDYVHVRR